jgi:hypothetical protein
MFLNSPLHSTRNHGIPTHKMTLHKRKEGTEDETSQVEIIDGLLHDMMCVRHEKLHN